MAKKKEDGDWVTIDGHPVFIKKRTGEGKKKKEEQPKEPEKKKEHKNVFDRSDAEIDDAINSFNDFKKYESFANDEWNYADQKRRNKLAGDAIRNYLKDNHLTEEEMLDLSDVMENENHNTEASLIGDIYKELYGKNEQKDVKVGDQLVDLSEPTKQYDSYFELEAPVNDFDAASQYLTDDDMTEYLPDELKEPVKSVEWVLDDEQSGHVEVKTTRDLTPDEEKSLQDWIDGQNSDGLGEGFEQQKFAEAYVDPDTGDVYDYQGYQDELERQWDNLDPEYYGDYLNDEVVDAAAEEYIKDNGYDIDDEDIWEEARQEIRNNPEDYLDWGDIDSAKQDYFNDYGTTEDDWYQMASMRRSGNFKKTDIKLDKSNDTEATLQSVFNNEMNGMYANKNQLYDDLAGSLGVDTEEAKRLYDKKFAEYETGKSDFADLNKPEDRDAVSKYMNIPEEERVRAAAEGKPWRDLVSEYNKNTSQGSWSDDYFTEQARNEGISDVDIANEIYKKHNGAESNRSSDYNIKRLLAKQAKEDALAKNNQAEAEMFDRYEKYFQAEYEKQEKDNAGYGYSTSSPNEKGYQTLTYKPDTERQTQHGTKYNSATDLPTRMSENAETAERIIYDDEWNDVEVHNYGNGQVYITNERTKKQVKLSPYDDKYSIREKIEDLASTKDTNSFAQDAYQAYISAHPESKMSLEEFKRMISR